MTMEMSFQMRRCEENDNQVVFGGDHRKICFLRKKRSIIFQMAEPHRIEFHFSIICDDFSSLCGIAGCEEFDLEKMINVDHGISASLLFSNDIQMAFRVLIRFTDLIELEHLIGFPLGLVDEPTTIGSVTHLGTPLTDWSICPKFAIYHMVNDYSASIKYDQYVSQFIRRLYNQYVVGGVRVPDVISSGFTDEIYQ